MPKTKRCIVIDMDQTLLATQDDMEVFHQYNPFRDPKYYAIRHRFYHLRADHFDEGEDDIFWGIWRPHAPQFLEFCLDYFESVCIWSTSKYSYVNNLIDQQFRSLHRRPTCIFTNVDCHVDETRTYQKPISKILLRKELSKYSLKNILILDDNTDTAKWNRENIIAIPAYNPDIEAVFNNADTDRHLLNVMEWLSEPSVLQAKDVRTLDKSTIFSR